jgi:hypothetical protein
MRLRADYVVAIAGSIAHWSHTALASAIHARSPAHPTDFSASAKQRIGWHRRCSFTRRAHPAVP